MAPSHILSRLPRRLDSSLGEGVCGEAEEVPGVPRSQGFRRVGLLVKMFESMPRRDSEDEAGECRVCSSSLPVLTSLLDVSDQEPCRSTPCIARHRCIDVRVPLSLSSRFEQDDLSVHEYIRMVAVAIRLLGI